MTPAPAMGTKDGTSVVTPTALKEAVERVTAALKMATRYSSGVAFGERADGFLSFADIESALTALSSQSATLEAMASALELARDMLLERVYGNPARSAGHNARLVIDTTLTQYRQGDL